MFSAPVTTYKNIPINNTYPTMAIKSSIAIYAISNHLNNLSTGIIPNVTKQLGNHPFTVCPGSHKGGSFHPKSADKMKNPKTYRGGKNKTVSNNRFNTRYVTSLSTLVLFHRVMYPARSNDQVIMPTPLKFLEVCSQCFQVVIGIMA